MKNWHFRNDYYEVQIKCDKCGKLIKTNDDHDENCTAKQEALANLTKAGRQRFVPDNVLWLVYGLILCAALAGMVVWKMYL